METVKKYPFVTALGVRFNFEKLVFEVCDNTGRVLESFDEHEDAADYITMYHKKELRA